MTMDGLVAVASGCIRIHSNRTITFVSPLWSVSSVTKQHLNSCHVGVMVSSPKWTQHTRSAGAIGFVVTSRVHDPANTIRIAVTKAALVTCVLERARRMAIHVAAGSFCTGHRLICGLTCDALMYCAVLYCNDRTVVFGILLFCAVLLMLFFLHIRGKTIMVLLDLRDIQVKKAEAALIAVTVAPRQLTLHYIPFSLISLFLIPVHPLHAQQSCPIEQLM